MKKIINNNRDKKLVLIDFGVGYNTPVIIKYPFKHITYNYDNVHLIRINLEYDDMVSNNIKNKSIIIRDDIGKILDDINAKLYEE